MTSFLPITAKLAPSRGNLAYLITSATIARLGVAVIRVEENAPSKNTDDRSTPNQKRLAMMERFFVEIPGTLLFTLIPLHLGQDLAAKAFERFSKKLAIPYFHDLESLPAGLQRHEAERINQAIVHVFGAHDASGKAILTPNGLIARMLFGENIPIPGEKTASKPQTTQVKARLSTLKSELGEALYQKATKALPTLEAFGLRLNRSSCWSILGGIVLSALFGGVVTQRLNDNVFSPWCKRWLASTYPDGEGHQASTPSKTSTQAASEETKKTQPLNTHLLSAQYGLPIAHTSAESIANGVRMLPPGNAVMMSPFALKARGVVTSDMRTTTDAGNSNSTRTTNGLTVGGGLV